MNKKKWFFISGLTAAMFILVTQLVWAEGNESKESVKNQASTHEQHHPDQATSERTKTSDMTSMMKDGNMDDMTSMMKDGNMDDMMGMMKDGNMDDMMGMMKDSNMDDMMGMMKEGNMEELIKNCKEILAKNTQQ